MHDFTLQRYARIPVELNREGVKEAVVITDTGVEPEVAEALAAAAYELGLEPTITVMVRRPVHGLEPTQVISQGILGAQLMLFATSTGFAHTTAVRTALKKGCKYIGMPEISVATLTGGAATADYAEVGRITREVAALLTAGSQVRITSGQGTDITFSIAGRPCFELSGVFRPGTIACFPDGEAAMAPVEGTANGIVVVDSSLHQIGILKEPVTWRFEAGRVVEVTGGDEARRLQDVLTARGDENSWVLGEFAVGTNPAARHGTTVSEDKKRLGSIHLALGDNLTLAGQNESVSHLDGVLGRPSLWVDGRLVIDKGRLVL
ncbi:MAG TPA: aminopeptidase [Firmicutes bacterium]|nr:aminopeptidase [Bacillota bacterium]